MKIIIYVFAFIGLFSVSLMLINYSKKDTAAKQYRKNCSKIKPGMTIQTAKLIMGDLQNSEYGGSIWTDFNNTDPVKKYCLIYPARLFTSVGVTIYFDPVTQVITDVICGE